MATPEIPKRRTEVKKPLTKKQREALKLKEAKEAREKEIKKARGLCANYHKKLDSKGYFNGKAMQVAKELLPKFLKLNVKLLPDSVQMVIRQRIAYLKLMAHLGRSKKIKEFIDDFKPSATSSGLFTKNIKELEKKAKKTKSFRNLNSDDFRSAIKAMKASKKMLKPLMKSKGNFAQRAKKYLMPANAPVKDVRVDDLVAAKNMHAVLDVLIKNLARLKRKKDVFEKPKAKAQSKKKAA